MFAVKGKGECWVWVRRIMPPICRTVLWRRLLLLNGVPNPKKKSGPGGRMNIV